MMSARFSTTPVVCPAGRSRSRFAGLLLAATLVGAIGTSHAAGLVFSDDFESGATSKWSQDGTHNLCKATTSAVDGVAPHSGKYNLECNWNGAVGWNDPAAYSTVKLGSWSYTSEFLIRLWLRYSSDVDHMPGNKAVRILTDNGHIDFFANAQMEVGGTPMFSSWDMAPSGGAGLPSFWGDNNSLGDGKWHKVEIYVKHNTSGQSNGAFKLWLDGSLKLQGANVVTVGSGDHWYPLYLMSNWTNNPGWNHDANNHAYWDDVQIFSDAGSGASGSLSDASISSGSSASAPAATPVPEAPSNLTVE